MVEGGVRGKRQRRLWAEVTVYLPGLVLLLAGFAVAYQFIKPAPPRHVVLATGTESGAYHASASRYRKLFARQGIELELRPTAGSVENLELLRSGEADAAFVQSGTAGDVPDGHGLTSLGSLYYEPLWLFHRQDLSLDRLGDLAGLRVAVGAAGSGTRALVTRLLDANQVAEGERLGLDPAAALAGLRDGGLDAAFLVGSPEGQAIRALFEVPNVVPASFARAPAYARRYRYLTQLTLPEGAMDLARNRPPREIRLLAPAANLVAGPELHPTIVDLLLLAAEEVHGAGGWFEARDQFPRAEYLEFPLNRHAARFYKHGPPFLQRVLPFWAASLADRLKVMLLPLVVLLIPLVKVMPPVYTWRMRARVYRWYERLEALDDAADEADAGIAANLLERLDALEREVLKVTVPLSFASQLYHLREHIQLVRGRLRTLRQQGPGGN